MCVCVEVTDNFTTPMLYWLHTAAGRLAVRICSDTMIRSRHIPQLLPKVHFFTMGKICSKYSHDVWQPGSDEFPFCRCLPACSKDPAHMEKTAGWAGERRFRMGISHHTAYTFPTCTSNYITCFVVLSFEKGLSASWTSTSVLEVQEWWIGKFRVWLYSGMHWWFSGVLRR